VLSSGSGAIVRLSNVDIFNNINGLNPVAGTIVSFGNNRLIQNTVNGAPTTTIGEI
jgi:hypothetical protein